MIKTIFILLVIIQASFQLSSILSIKSQNQWTLLNSNQFGKREGLMGVSFGDYVYIAGGRSLYGVGFTNDVWRSKDGQQWEQVTKNAPWEDRAYHIMLTMNNCIYLMGGQNFFRFFNDVWKSCDGENWTEVTKAAPWVVRAGLAASVINDTIIVTGGSFQTTPFSTRSFYNDVWASKDGANWELLNKQAPFIACSGPRLITYNQTLYLIGGENGFSEQTQFNHIWSSTNGIDWEFVTNGTWSIRSGHGVVIYQEKIYLIAGYLNLHDLWISQDLKNWNIISDRAFNCDNKDCGRFDFWSLEHKGNLLVIGGSGASTTFGKLYDEVWQYTF